MGLPYASQWFSHLSPLTLNRFSSSSTRSLSRFNRSYTQIKVTTNFSPKRQPQRPPFKTMASSTQVVDATARQDKVTAPYGSWKSPITADVVSGASKQLSVIAVDCHGHLFWVESRPSESGRSVLVREADKPGEEPTDITPKEFAVRTTAQEYGGGEFTISEDTVIYSNYKDQRLYNSPSNQKILLLCRLH